MNFLMAGTQGQAKDLLVSFSYENYIGKITLFDNVTPGLPDQLFDEYSILKSEEAAKNYFKQVSPQFIVAIASPPKRKIVANKLKTLGGTNFSYLSTRSNISANTNISEEGVIIQVTCMVSNNVTIERGVLVNVKTEISHNVSIGEYTTLAPDVLVNNGVTIGSNCIISTGVTILPGIKIGNNVKVWMNKVVDKDLPDNTNFI